MTVPLDKTTPAANMKGSFHTLGVPVWESLQVVSWAQNPRVSRH